MVRPVYRDRQTDSQPETYYREIWMNRQADKQAQASRYRPQRN